MAEGWANHLLGADYRAYSAGVATHGINPRAAQVMGEAGVDISKQTSKLVEELPAIDFDQVYTLCGPAAETCPTIPGAKHVTHVPFDDPPGLTKGLSDEKKVLEVYSRVRDEIRQFIETLDS